MLIIRSREAAQALRRLTSTPRLSSPESCRDRSKVRDPEGAFASTRGACAPQRRSRLDVAPAPLKLLPDHTEERCIGQRGQWKSFLCSANGDDGAAFNVDGSAAIQGQVHWIIGMTRFDFDDRFIRDNDRAVCENVRTNRCDDEYAGLGIENRSPGRQRVSGGSCRSRDN